MQSLPFLLDWKALCYKGHTQVYIFLPYFIYYIVRLIKPQHQKIFMYPLQDKRHKNPDR